MLVKTFGSAVQGVEAIQYRSLDREGWLVELKNKQIGLNNFVKNTIKYSENNG